MSNPEPWHTDVVPKDPNLKTENVQFVFSEAKACLDSTERSYDGLTQKANWMLGIILTISTGLGAYFLAATPASLGDWLLLVPLGVYAYFTVRSVNAFLAVLKADDIGMSGYNPVKLFQMRTIGKEHTRMLCGVIERYGEKIYHNLTLNDRKAGYFSDGTRDYLYALISLAVGFLAVRYVGTLFVPVIRGWLLGVVAPVCSVHP